MCHCRPCHLTPSNPLQPWRLNCLVLSILPLFSGHNQLCCQELMPSFLFPSNSSTGTCVRPRIFQLGCQREGIFSNPEWDEVLFKSANREQRGTSEVKGCVCVCGGGWVRCVLMMVRCHTGSSGLEAWSPALICALLADRLAGALGKHGGVLWRQSQKFSGEGLMASCLSPIAKTLTRKHV